MSWYTVDNRNNTIYWKYENVIGTKYSGLQQAVITTGDYSLATLATEIETRMNLVAKTGDPNDPIDFGSNVFSFAVNPNLYTNTLTFSILSPVPSSAMFKILTDTELLNEPPASNQSVNNILQNSTPWNCTITWTSQYINLHSIRN